MANKYYVDELYDVLFVRSTKLILQAVDRWFERATLDGLIDGSALLLRYGAARLRALQTGYVRNYALGILFGAVLLVGYYVVGGH
jgi:NADH-quinone oxidoreductase subunit L